MKCSQCKLITAETNDLCPRCHFDLRPAKLALGLAVIDEVSPASKLRAEAAPVLPQKSSSNNQTPAPTKVKSKSIFGAFLKRNKEISKTPDAPPAQPAHVVIPEEVPVLEPDAPELLVENFTLPPEAVTPHEDFASSSNEIELSDAPQVESLPEVEMMPEQELSTGIEFTLPTEETVVSSLAEVLDEVSGAIDAIAMKNYEPELLEPEAPKPIKAKGPAPQVIEFNDDELSLEEQLAALLGDDSLGMEEVAFVPAAPMQQKAAHVETSPQLEVTPDSGLEISIEIEIEEDEAPPQVEAAPSTLELPKPEVAKAPAQAPITASAPSAPNPSIAADDFLGGLLSTFAELDEEESEQAPEPAPLVEAEDDITKPFVHKLSNPVGDKLTKKFDEIDVASLLKSVKQELAGSNNVDSNAMEAMFAKIAQAYGVQLDGTTKEDALNALQDELDSELEMLLGEGTSFLALDESEATTVAQMKPAAPELKEEQAEELVFELD